MSATVSTYTANVRTCLVALRQHKRQSDEAPDRGVKEVATCFRTELSFSHPCTPFVDFVLPWLFSFFEPRRLKRWPRSSNWHLRSPLNVPPMCGRLEAAKSRTKWMCQPTLDDRFLKIRAKVESIDSQWRRSRRGSTRDLAQTSSFFMIRPPRFLDRQPNTKQRCRRRTKQGLLESGATCTTLFQPVPDEPPLLSGHPSALCKKRKSVAVRSRVVEPARES